MDVDEELVTFAAHCGPVNLGREALLCGGARGVDHGTDSVRLAGQPDETHDVSLSRTPVNGQVSKEDNSPIMHHCSGNDVTHAHYLQKKILTFDDLSLTCHITNRMLLTMRLTQCFTLYSVLYCTIQGGGASARLIAPPCAATA